MAKRNKSLLHAKSQVGNRHHTFNAPYKMLNLPNSKTTKFEIHVFAIL